MGVLYGGTDGAGPLLGAVETLLVFFLFFFFSFFAFNEGEVYLVKFPQLKFPFKSARLLRITLPTGQPYHRTPRGEEKKYK